MKKFIITILLVFTIISCERSKNRIVTDSGSVIYNMEAQLEVGDEFSFEKRLNNLFDQSLFGVDLRSDREYSITGTLLFLGDSNYSLDFDSCQLTIIEDNTVPGLSHHHECSDGENCKDPDHKHDSSENYKKFSQEITSSYSNTFDKLDIPLKFSVAQDNSITLLNYDEYLEKLNGISDYFLMKGEFKDFFKEDVLVAFVRDFFSWYPYTYPEVGEKWSYSLPYYFPVEIETFQEFVLQKVTRRNSHLQFSSSNSFSLEEDEFFYDGTISTSGDLVVSRKNSFIKKKSGTIVVNVVHSIMVTLADGTIEPFESPYSMRQKYVLELDYRGRK
ncbi:MAG: hypothetical protein JXR63_01725 [Spirochaetales bacterium]|nr:hypothetical protein [Spirochaetales bacterium]